MFDESETSWKFLILGILFENFHGSLRASSSKNFLVIFATKLKENTSFNFR